MNPVVLVIFITAPLAALATSFAEHKIHYNLYDLVKDAILGLLPRLPLVGRFIGGIVIIALLVTLAARISRAQSAVANGTAASKPSPRWADSPVLPERDPARPRRRDCQQVLGARRLASSGVKLAVQGATRVLY